MQCSSKLSTLRRLSLIGLSLSAIALGGCTRSTSAYDVLAYDEPARRGVTSQSVSWHRRWAELPADAGQVLDVIEMQRPKTLTQRIVLRGEGGFRHENMIRLERGGKDGTAPDLLRSPRLDEIVAELSAYDLSRSFVIADEPASNAYGPFGYAYVRDGSGTCVYAWQWLDLRNVDGASTGIGFRKQPISIRVHLCQSRPLGAIVAAIRNLRLFPASGGEAFVMSQSGGSGGDALSIANRTMGVLGRTSAASAQPAASRRTVASVASEPPTAPARKPKAARPSPSTTKSSGDAETVRYPRIPAPGETKPASAASSAKIASGSSDKAPASVARKTAPSAVEALKDAPLIPSPAGISKVSKGVGSARS
ncbi:cellulose biosynthesis protein BcsN [Fulvimarina sp. MAC3]|uniref:cellulose biosynthesis protein BcsN n=1 Tax=Fulvimarina sp. MAC3 TaxID=3148887 RepID=UPI0031FCA2F6